MSLRKRISIQEQQKKSDSRKKIEKSDYLNNHPTNYQEILYPKSWTLYLPTYLRPKTMFHFTNVPPEANFYPRTAKKSDSRKKIENRIISTIIQPIIKKSYTQRAEHKTYQLT